MPLQATSGAASYDGFGGGVAAVPNYIEDVFSTYIYTTNNTSLTVTNGINISLYGGMTWFKPRTDAALDNNIILDTARSAVGGARPYLITNSTAAQSTSETPFYPGSGFDWTTTGFGLGQTEYANGNQQGSSSGGGVAEASWTFRKQPKFFDVVTFTSGAGTQTISHNLGATPGMIIVKCTTVSDSWYVWHRSIPNNALALNTTQSTSTFTNPEYIFGNGSVVVQPTSTQFTFYAGNSGSNTYVAYIYAHDAGGFGLTGTDNVISCGSYTGNGSATGPVVTLKYEPQWVLIKNASDVSNWSLIDNMRGWNVIDGAANVALMSANLTSAEVQSQKAKPLSTGFQINDNGSVVNTSGATYIYIAIRRGPMKVPTTGTSVYTGITITGNGASDRLITGTNSPIDLVFGRDRNRATNWGWYDRLRGAGAWLRSNGTEAEVATIYGVDDFGVMNGFRTDNNFFNANGYIQIAECFSRAPSFMDVVAYNRTSSAAVTHNLGVTPELLIIKRRGGVEPWGVMRPNTTGYLLLNATDALSTGLSATATSTTFTIGSGAFDYTDNYVVYLFATCAGVSKVGSYTGTATTKQIDCGFTAGARFVLIKKTSGTGSWYVWDSARGIVSGNDPYLLLNSTAAEVTNTDYIDTYSAGFEISSTAPSEINENGGSFIFLAIA